MPSTSARSATSGACTSRQYCENSSQLMPGLRRRQYTSLTMAILLVQTDSGPNEQQQVVGELADAASAARHHDAAVAAVEMLRGLTGKTEAPAQRAERPPPPKPVLVPDAARGLVAVAQAPARGRARPPSSRPRRIATSACTATRRRPSGRRCARPPSRGCRRGPSSDTMRFPLRASPWTIEHRAGSSEACGPRATAGRTRTRARTAAAHPSARAGGRG